MLGGPHHSGPENSRKKGKGKRKSKGESRGTGRAFLGEQREQKPELWSEKDSTCWFKRKRGKKGCSKGNESLRKGGLRTSPSQKGSSSDYDSHKGKGKDQKGKDKECVIQQSGFSASENSVEEGQVHSIGIPIALMIPPIQLAEAPLRGTIQDTLHGSHQFLWISTTIRRALFFDLDCTQSIASKSAIWWFQKYALYHDKTTEFCPCNKSFVFANSETEMCRESCIINFPTTPPCSTRVDVLEPGDLPVLFSLLRMGNLGKTIELDSKGDKITCPAFALYSSPVEYSTMGHSVLDLTSLAYQPKSRERSARPTKHVTFALMPQKSAYTARSQEMDDDEDDKPFFRSDPTTVSEDEDDKPVVQPASRSESVKREPAAIRGVPTPLRRRKGPPIWRDPSGETGTGRVMNFA